MEKQKQQLEYAIRLIFGIVHSIFISLIGLGLALLFPSLTTILFGLVGFIFLPILSMILSCLANASIIYISNKRKIDWQRAVQWSWYPAIGIMGISICVLPLEYIHPNFFGDVNLMFGMFLIGITITSFLLQVYAGLRVQTSSASSGSSPM
jgi:hypothetical protein